MEVVHGGRVSEEAILAIRPLLLAYQDSWRAVKFMELNTISVVIPLKLFVDLDLRAVFFHI